ncbi:hypothetical protein [Paraliomyxa miuraensis]|uniref:hypothetical protein n=1 Tax=Paraliomyxa miuraensis TaxID=376150 RepID=UPI00225A7A1E|nr:hypothetical protein [Paraliomyxa miuraensis]MCX4241018.1 hypothetical protein [Paraliomyxa miuraensis]
MVALRRVWILVPAAAVVGVGLVACQDPENGIGQGPTGGDDGPPVSTGALDSDVDSGLDDTQGTETPPPAAKSYFIAESMDFTGNDCSNTDVNEVSASLRAELDDDGWVGTRLTEGDTRPSDFIDADKRPFGEDHLKSDAVSLAVYAGHGWMDKIQWGTQDDAPTVEPPEKRCRAWFSEDIRLGSMAGGWAKAVALLTSCTGNLGCYESSLATSSATQIFAFNNSPLLWSNASGRFYRKSDHMSNRNAWITAMDNRPGQGKNSPVVYTRGTSEEQAIQIHRTARLSQIEQIPSDQATTWYAYTWVDHGLHGSCTPKMGDEDCVPVDD